MSYSGKVGSYTKYLREKLGYSLQELARRANLDAAFLLRLEKGEYKTIKLDTIEMLARAFEMHVEEFLYKCGVITKEPRMPRLAQYMKEKYQFPPEAVDDLRMFITVLHQKYRDRIQSMKESHDRFWSGTAKR